MNLWPDHFLSEVSRLYIPEFRNQGDLPHHRLGRRVTSDVGCKISLGFYSSFFSCKAGIIILSTQGLGVRVKWDHSIRRRACCLALSKCPVLIRVAVILKHDGKSHLLVLDSEKGHLNIASYNWWHWESPLITTNSTVYFGELVSK